MVKVSPVEGFRDSVSVAYSIKSALLDPNGSETKKDPSASLRIGAYDLSIYGIRV